MLIVQCERCGGEGLLSNKETLHTLGQLHNLWVEVCMQLFRRHPSLDRETPKGQAAMTELSHAITELHTQLDIRINGESGKRFSVSALLYLLYHQVLKFRYRQAHSCIVIMFSANMNQEWNSSNLM